MLYVFHVDCGKMMRFDMNIALESVGVLKEHIQEVSGIPSEKQVLLISGGESLDPNKRVCSYTAGTDTNPIFLFSRSVIECATAPPPLIEHAFHEDLQQKVKEHCDLPVTLSTVAKRAQLAQHFHKLARDLQAICENLVHDQHLQQQGWSAVLANLEDIVEEFRKRLAVFEKTFKDYMDFRETYIKFLSNFNSDLETLQRIPVLTVLLELEKQNSGVGSEDSKIMENNTTGSSSSNSDSKSKEITLYEWISSSDDRSTLDQLYEHCQRGLEQFDEQVFKKLKDEIDELVKNAESTHMKEIKGLGERLFGLDQLMRDAKSIVRQQGELAQAFLNNQSRANNTKDTSVLPDLCISHKKQLLMMANNHQHLGDIKRRCINSKNELNCNLHTRLRWVMFIEQQMVDSNHKLIIYHENLKRLQRYLEVLQQIHLTPTTYLNAVVEVVRRREFSQAYLLWSSELACHLLTIHNEEVTRRKEFQAQFEGHFLNSLFPGLHDLPPSFATQAPSLFDTSLPKITEEDIDRLKLVLPDLVEHLNVPDISAITNFFLIKSIAKRDEEKQYMSENYKAVEEQDFESEEKTIDAVANDVVNSNLECGKTVKALPHLKDFDRGCESETDTEEFEKVGQSPLELNFDQKSQIPSPRRRTTQDVASITEVGERSPVPPKSPEFLNNKSHSLSPEENSTSNLLHRTLNINSLHSNTDIFSNLKHLSFDSITEFTSLGNILSTQSCFNSHNQQMLSNIFYSRTPSISPHTSQTPQGGTYPNVNSPHSPFLGHQEPFSSSANDFLSDEYYIDESLPSSLNSETGHSQGDYMVKQLDTANSVVALLQDNLQSSRTEYEKLTSVLIKLQYFSKESLGQLRLGLSEIKSQVLNDRNTLSQSCESLSSSWENLIVERDTKEKESINNLRRNYEKEINEIKIQEMTKTKEIERLKLEKEVFESEILETNEALRQLKGTFDRKMEENMKEIEELKNQLLKKDVEKERSLKETTDRLNREHKAEIENIRSRFKLMTMERSPSDTNLEKSSDFSSLPSHSTLLMQMTENFEMDKERAVNEALVQERCKWEKILEKKIQNIELKFQAEKEKLVRQISEEKDKQIDVLWEREKNLNLECLKYKDTIHQLTETEKDTFDSDLFERLNMIQKEKEILEEELEKLRQERTLVPLCSKDKVDVTTSPVKEREPLTITKTEKIGRLNIDQCKTGDHVLVIWDQEHQNFRIVQENKYKYFLHAICLESLGLEVYGGKPNKTYVVGEVIDKDYCYARKSENRYNVPKGSKFFRVKVRPVSQAGSSKECSEQSLEFVQDLMSQSQSVIVGMFESTVLEKLGGSDSLPSSPPKYHHHPTIYEKEEGDTIVSTEKVISVSEAEISNMRREIPILYKVPTTESNVPTLNHPEVHKPESIEEPFTEDSETVGNIEQAKAALDDYRNDCESSAR